MKIVLHPPKVPQNRVPIDRVICGKIKIEKTVSGLAKAALSLRSRRNVRNETALMGTMLPFIVAQHVPKWVLVPAKKENENHTN
mmetsp:Transcript_63085/g.70548  ORF Transcript_63085/g.70548 Transcript_63085/m.70548 type:complete len:84 (+) Transcript_63085:1244-1495(+)